MTSAPPAIVWFRLDLRVADNPALTAAARRGEPVVPVYILDNADTDRRAPGAASRWWLHHALSALADRLDALGAPLVLRSGDPHAVLQELVDETGAEAVFWNRRYAAGARACDAELKSKLRDRGLEVESFNGALLCEPWTLQTGAGKPYAVFTPFWKALLAHGEPAPPEPAPERLSGTTDMPATETLDSWNLLPRIAWDAGLHEAWTPGEAGARRRLAAFLDDGLDGYAERRDRPDLPGTSRISPHLHHGELSPRTVWHATLARVAEHGERLRGDAMAFLRELGWRDFSYNLLFHNPDLPTRNFKPAFDAFPWADNAPTLRAWERGATGYPIVDAGMRELYRTGWMHNRVRMITASFLVKHLLLPWQAGEAWFWDTLVDADLANNAASWQWVAGSGADAAPYFRIFNPMTQGRKFDPEGAYVRRWVPEIAALPDKFIHAPWEAPHDVMRAAGVALGDTYPHPIVDHARARARALDAFQSIKASAA